MLSELPITSEQILATGKIDPSFADQIAKNPIPEGSFYTIEDLKILSEFTVPRTQQELRKTRPSDITETEHLIPLRDGFKSRVVLCHKTERPLSGSSPLIVLLFGGGHTVGCPESEVPLARLLAQAYDAVVLLPCYRLAPENPFPSSINDSWDSVQWLAQESRKANSTILPPWTNPKAGFIVGGTSAGAGLSAAIAHLARDSNLDPPLTGQYLAAGTFISSQNVPQKYKHLYLSRAQNARAPVLDIDLYNLFMSAFKPDHTSPLYASFDQHHPEDEPGMEVKTGHMGVPPAYFQICGMDLARDDSLIYERVLREECGVQTKADLYVGYPHCWWITFPKIEKSQDRLQDAVEGIGWLLQVGTRTSTISGN